MPPDRPLAAVDIIVPVYGAAAELHRCLKALEGHTNLRHHQLVVVDDAGEDPEVDEVLRQVQVRFESTVEILHNETRLGFVGSVNRGMARSDRDVVLLNSDTEVTAGWIDKMQQAAYSASAIATVTPFSNDATICSLPRPLEANDIPAGFDVDSFAQQVEASSIREYPRLPSGVGMCLYIKRKVLDEIGLFDASSFGLGYGEENEHCLRALERGYVHVLDDATFVYHAGQRSFGASSREHKDAAHRMLRRFHPRFLPTITRFLEEDPLRPARQRVLDRLRPPRSTRGHPFSRVLHLVHGWPPWDRAGTELYARWLALRQVPHREVTAYARMTDPTRGLGEAREYLDHGVRVRLAINNFFQRNPLSRASLHNSILERDFTRLLDETQPQLLHVHHMVGHSASLLVLARRRRIPILYQVQDWWPACARVNLTHASHEPCSGPSIDKCARCMPLTGVSPLALWNRGLHLYRRWWLRHVLRMPAAYVMGSRFIETSYRGLGLLRPQDRVFVHAYGVPLASHPRPERKEPGSQKPLHFGYIGSLLPHKGPHLAIEAFRDLDPEQVRLDLWGDPEASPAYTELLRAKADPDIVRFQGRFEEAVKAQILGQLDALIVPSIGLESFGLVAREAMAVGTPVIAARGSALDEMNTAEQSGTFFEQGDSLSLRRLVSRLSERPETLAEWSRELPAVKSMEEHAAEMEEVYEEVAWISRSKATRGQ